MIAIDLHGRSVLITGAGAGIGSSIVDMLARCGAEVAVVDIDGDAAVDVARRVEASGGTALAVTADVRDDEAMRAAAALVDRELAPLAGIVNNAGVTRRGDVARGTLPDWDFVLETNLRGTLIASRAVLPALRRSKGAVVNITSVAATHPAPGRTGYTASKAAVTGLTLQMALEWAPFGVRVNAVAPGVISGTRLSAHESDELRARRAAMLPMRRTGTGEDVAGTVAFLLSDLARYVTGQSIAVDGGWSVSLLDRLPGVGSAADRPPDDR